MVFAKSALDNRKRQQNMRKMWNRHWTTGNANRICETCGTGTLLRLLPCLYMKINTSMRNASALEVSHSSHWQGEIDRASLLSAVVCIFMYKRVYWYIAKNEKSLKFERWVKIILCGFTAKSIFHACTGARTPRYNYTHIYQFNTHARRSTEHTRPFQINPRRNILPQSTGKDIVNYTPKTADILVDTYISK